MNLNSNMLEKDPMFIFSKIIDGQILPITLEELTEWVKDIKLNQNVPKEVNDIFETSKQLFVHGYFYYRFFSVSRHYAYLALEAALQIRHKKLFSNVKDKSLFKVINRLSEKGIITDEEKYLYDAGRKLRNDFSHLSDPVIVSPSVICLERTRELINKIFNEENQ